MTRDFRDFRSATWTLRLPIPSCDRENRNINQAYWTKRAGELLEPVFGRIRAKTDGIGGWRSDGGVVKCDDLKILLWRAEGPILNIDCVVPAMTGLCEEMLKPNEMLKEAGQEAVGFMLGLSDSNEMGSDPYGLSNSGEIGADHFIEVPPRASIERSKQIQPLASDLAHRINASIRGSDICWWAVSSMDAAETRKVVVELADQFADLFSGATAQWIKGKIHICAFADKIPNEKEIGNVFAKSLELCKRYPIDVFGFGDGVARLRK